MLAFRPRLKTRLIYYYYFLSQSLIMYGVCAVTPVILDTFRAFKLPLLKNEENPLRYPTSRGTIGVVASMGTVGPTPQPIGSLGIVVSSPSGLLVRVLSKKRISYILSLTKHF